MARSRIVRSRQLEHYPTPTARARHLGVVVVVTISVYYALYLKGSVAPQIIDEYDMSLGFYVSISILGSLLGSGAALAAALADRIGRTGLMIYGSLFVALMTLLVTPNMPTKQLFLAADVTVSATTGVVLVASTALIRDFAPQLTRAVAMTTWNLGPILGSLLVSSVASRTLDAHPDWRFQYTVCGIVGLSTALLGLLALRELSPGLRAQVLHSADDAAAAEARAAGTTGLPERGAWRVLMTPRIILPTIGIGLFLVFYFTRLGFWVIFFVTTHGFTGAQANGLSNWWWATSAVTLVAMGALADGLGIRKPLMLVGAIGSIIALSVFGNLAAASDTSYRTFVLAIIPAAFFGVTTSGMWITAFSEAVEEIAPQLVATGMALYGWIVRLVAAGTFLAVLLAVPAASILADHGARVAGVSQQYATPLAQLQRAGGTVEKLTAALAATGADRLRGSERAQAQRDLEAAQRAQGYAAQQIPTDDLAYLTAHGADVAQAAADTSDQWESWWRVCLVMQLLFLPTIWLLPGHWFRRRAPAPIAEPAPA
ncbi:hypothetical protein GCM10022215_14750 [Nocardioides fonticola]|uniref:Major facilitator superfamily (MFS) profile domain-containing protein n=1 Tax=Nocardioides fonticola TaxID=450363 RepID=A0ABP7XGB3_9ACTN